MAGIYAADGTYNINVVPGTSFVGRYGTNGGLNVVQVNGSAQTGHQHVSGAINVFNAVGTEEKAYHPCGAFLVTNAGKHNIRGVTVLTGSLT